MRDLTNPKWLFLIHTLPLALLASLCYGEFTVIKTLLPPASIVTWQWLATALGGLLLGVAGYAAAQLRRRQPLSMAYGVVALVAHIGFLWVSISQDSLLVPGDVPRWMVPTSPLLLALTFVMPTLAHALFVLVVGLTPEDRPQRAGVNFALAFAVPMGWYALFSIPGSLWSGPTPDFVEYGFVGVFLISTLSFLFFLVRGVYILSWKGVGSWGRYELAWKVVLTLLLPLLGLAVNNGLLFSMLGSRSEEAGIFGNFNSPWFYALAVLNGVLLCLPADTRPLPRLLLFVGRSITLGYTFYFFLVFLPFLPFSVLAVIAVGTGFLMLTPLVLLVLHVRELSSDYNFLRGFFSRWQLTAALVAGAAVLPVAVTATYWHQRQVLHEALAYLYSPDYSKNEPLDEKTLASTLALVRQHKQRNQDFLLSSKLPFLSTYYNWLVLDNLTLSDEKLASMEQVFFGAPTYEQPTLDRPASQPRASLQSVTTQSAFDAKQQAWVSWVNLEVANSTAVDGNTEYAAELELPTGCWINGYYLNIGNRREAGILAEKKAAHWVFSQIVNENKDPGILHYLSGNRVALRVFPVAGSEVRKTGIRFLHKEPVVLTLDGRQVTLGDSAAAPRLTVPISTPDKAVTYVSAAAKKRLPLVRRRPYYHFLLDVSKDKREQKTAYIRQVQELLAKHPLSAPSRFSLVSTYATAVPAAEWQNRLTQAPNKGGLYLDGAIRRVLVEAYEQPRDTYPIMVVVTDKLENAVLTQDFADLSAAYPEAPWFYYLASNDSLRAHDLRREPRRALKQRKLDSGVVVRAWPNANAPRAYLPEDQQASIVVHHSKMQVSEETSKGSSWQTGLLLHGYGLAQALHPETTDAERVPAIRASFHAGILTPFTSYLALENEAQKAALRRKQDQVLAGNAALDAGEEAPPTAVPIDGGASLLLAAGAALGIRRLRKTRRRATP